MKLSEAFAKNYNALMRIGRYTGSPCCGAEAPGGGVYCTMPNKHPVVMMHVAQDHNNFVLATWPSEAYTSQFKKRSLDGEG